jgi:hypothetical protein
VGLQDWPGESENGEHQGTESVVVVVSANIGTNPPGKIKHLAIITHNTHDHETTFFTDYVF